MGMGREQRASKMRSRDVDLGGDQASKFRIQEFATWTRGVGRQRGVLPSQRLCIG